MTAIRSPGLNELLQRQLRAQQQQQTDPIKRPPVAQPVVDTLDTTAKRNPLIRGQSAAPAMPAVDPAFDVNSLYDDLTKPARAPSTGFPLGSTPLEGYDNAKLNDPNHRTVKYVFGRVATQFPLDTVKDKASAEALLNRMRPAMLEAGLNIRDVKGDKILVDTPLGQEWVDVIRGASAGKNPGWQWGSTGAAVPGTEGDATPKHIPLADASKMSEAELWLMQLEAALNASPEDQQKATLGSPEKPKAPKASGGGKAPGKVYPPWQNRDAGKPLSTVPITAVDQAMAAKIDKSSVEAAVKSAATIVKQTMPEIFPKGDDRKASMEVMTHVIATLRAAGIDAHRVVNHDSRPVGNEGRYGSDALAVGGVIFDVYGSMGESATPQALNQGTLGDRPRE